MEGQPHGRLSNVECNVACGGIEVRGVWSAPGSYAGRHVVSRINCLVQ
jgi:hypothetical protein